MPSALENLLLLVGPFSLLIQIALCVHVYKTGRPYWWIWIILMGSLIGCVLYALLELLPEARRQGPRLVKTSWFVPKSVRLRRAREVVEDSPTVENKLALAAMLSDYGRKDEAATVAAECPSGVFKDDPIIIAEVARHQLEAGRLADAEQLVARANTKNHKSARTRLDLLQGRILFGHQRYAEALAVFEPLLPAALGEEARYYFALCHLGVGEREKALELFTDITKKYRKGGAIWRRAEKDWFKAAKQKIRDIQFSNGKPVPMNA